MVYYWSDVFLFHDTSSSLKRRQLLFEQIDVHWIDGFIIICVAILRMVSFSFVAVVGAAIICFIPIFFLMMKNQRLKSHHNNDLLLDISFTCDVQSIIERLFAMYWH